MLQAPLSWKRRPRSERRHCIPEPKWVLCLWEQTQQAQLHPCFGRALGSGRHCIALGVNELEKSIPNHTAWLPAGPLGLSPGQLGRGALGMVLCDTRGDAPLQEQTTQALGTSSSCACTSAFPELSLENGIST